MIDKIPVKPNWLLIRNTPEDLASMVKLFRFVLSFFEQTFGKTIMTQEFCEVENFPEGSYALFRIFGANPIRIETCAFSTDHWAQYVYQLAHELTHYAIRQTKRDKHADTIKWFEETLAEAFSLYALHCSGQRWKQCKLHKLNPGYNKSFIDYLKNELSKPPGDALSRCRTLSDLELVNAACEEQRQERRAERNGYYALFLQHRLQIKTILKYSWYIQDNRLLVDFEKWANDDPENAVFIEQLSAIQPSLAGGHAG